MPCFAPITIKNPLYQNKDPTARERWKKRVHGSTRAVTDMLQGFRKYIQVPCGKCYGCMRMRCNGWVFRHLLELKNCYSAHFVTLTYSEEYLPYTENGSPCFSKEHVQKYIKRIRKYLSDHDLNCTLKYHLASEYGDEFGRPHYHLILYNFPFEEEHVDQLSKKWPYGQVHVGSVTEASIRYTVEYITQFYYEEEFPTEEEKPFALYSKGIGSDAYPVVANYITSTKKNVYPIDGKTYRIPNSYLTILRERGFITPFTFYKIKENALDYYEQVDKITKDTIHSRGVNVFLHTQQEFIEQREKFRRKYKLRKQGVN